VEVRVASPNPCRGRLAVGRVRSSSCGSRAFVRADEPGSGGPRVDAGQHLARQALASGAGGDTFTTNTAIDYCSMSGAR